MNTRTMADLNLTGSEVALVKDAYKRNNISKENAVDFLFFCESEHKQFGNVFGGESMERTNAQLDAKARKFKKLNNL